MEEEILVLQKKIQILKEENLYLQRQLSMKDSNVIDQLKSIKKEIKESSYDEKGGYVFKTQDNIGVEDTFFIDLLLSFYEEVIEYVNLGREYEEDNDNKNIEYILYKIIESYQENREIMKFYISERRIEYIDRVVEVCRHSDMTNIEKIEYFYNKIYYEIFVEFMGNYSFSA